MLFETWREISRWVGITGAKLEKIPPWESTAPYYTLSKKLDDFEEKLPAELKYNEFNLQHTLPVAQLLISHTLVGCYCYAGYFSTENTFMHLQKRLRQDGGKQATILFDSLDKLTRYRNCLNR